MEQEKQDLINQIQDILNYIETLKKQKNSFDDEYKKLSNTYTPIVYKKPSLLDKIFSSKYKIFLRDYAHSERTKKELEELNHNSLLIQMEIEALECVLFKLQNELSKYNSSQDNSEHTINQNSINEKDVILE